MADLKEKAVAVLSETTVSLAGVAATTLYTVPTGKTCILDKVVISVSADAGASTVTVGQVGALTDFLPTQTLTALNVAQAAGILSPVPNATTVLHVEYTAGEIIQMDVTAANGNATNTVYLFGTLDDA